MRETMTVMPLKDLKDVHVVNPQGEDLGKIEDFAIDMSSGRIAYAVLSFGEFLGMGGKFFAVPWNAFSFHERDKRWVLNVPKEKLEHAPGFDKDRWPDFADRRWGEEVYRYYGYDPYWSSGYRGA